MSTTPVDLDFSTFTPLDSGPPAAAKLRQSVAYGVQQNPDEYARLLKQQQVTGMAPELAKPLWGETQNAIDVERLQPEQMAVSHPRTAAWASNPDNAAVAGVDEIQRLARIEHHADTMSAYTPTWRDKVSDASQSAFEFMGGTGSLKKNFFDFPLFRLGVGALRGTEDTAGNVGAFFGIHGDNGGPNSLQRAARTLEPGQFGEQETGLDKVAAQAGPMIPAVLASGGTALLARTLGLSDKAAKVFAGLAVGGLFSADQGGSTYGSIKESGASDYDARLAANRVAAMTAPANALYGATEVVPFLRNNPLLSSLGIGGAAGASGQVAQNVVTGRPAMQGTGLAALQGAAAQGGMHLGMGFLEHFAAAVGESQASQLRSRAPEVFAEATKMNFAGAESLRIPADRFTEYFKSKGIDPAAAAEELGSSNYAEAFLSGGDVEVRPESYLTNLAEEHQNALLHDVVDPSTGMTARDVQEAGKELDDWANGGAANKLVEDMQAADAETQATPEWQKVYSDLKQRYADTGESDAEADSHASLQANAIAYFAKNAGMKPDELLALHEPEIRAAEAPGTQILNQPAFHGSPYKFDKFTLDHMGSGEGAQAYGWGLYFAGDKNIAEQYRKALAAPVEVDGKPPENLRSGESAMANMFQNRKAAKLSDAVAREQTAKWAKSHPQIGKEYTSEKIDKFVSRLSSGRGQLYHVDIPEDDEMLHWDKPLSEQPEKVKAALKVVTRDHDAEQALIDEAGRKGVPVTEMPGYADLERQMDEAARFSGQTGEQFYRELSESIGDPDGTKAERASALGLDLPAAADQQASEYLHSLGISGIKYLDGPSRAKGEGSHNYVVFDDNAIKVLKTYYQDPKPGDARKARNIEVAKIQGEMVRGEQPRGWFRVLPDGRFEIGKTSIGDLSTFVHEPAHAYLELFRELTQREGASEPLKDDFRKLTEWLGTTPEEAYKNGFTREQHEKWASANEQYVSEGKAPTAGLRRAFHNFAVWLGKIYDRARTLKVDLSPDIRGVMDRLYAGEEAVDRAGQGTGEPLFTSPEEAGWTEQEYRNYADAKGVAVDKAREQVRREMNEAAQRDRTLAWREERVNVREAVTQQVDSQREYTAIRSLRRGALDDGTELKLNRDALVKQFGEERVAALQQAHRGLYRLEGGSDPEAAAELLGFDSADEMLRKLTEAPRRSKAIEDATRDVMTARHGDIRYDGSLDDKARLAVENDDRAKGLHQELAALKRRVSMLETRAAKTKAAMRAITLAPLDAYQKAAHEMIEAKPIADIQPHRYLDASRKYSREAFDAVRKGSVDHAADAKHKELLNHFLFREASAARDYVEKFERYVKQSVQSKGIQQRLALAGSDFRSQFNQLLWRYGLGPAPQQGRYEIPGRSLRDWAAERFAVGEEPVNLPNILDETRGKDYRNVPLSEIRDLHDMLLNIRTLARQQFEMFVQGKRIEFSDAKNAMIEAARSNLKVKPEQVFDENRSGSAITRGLQWADSKFIRVERLIEWLDGGKAGPWHDHLWNLASDAQGDEYELQEKVTRQVTDALADMPDEMRRRLWTEKVDVEGVSEPLTRRRMLSMAFNMGNEGNLDRLRKTFIHHDWDPDAIQRVGGMLTREEWQFVQKSWESLKPLGERMQELERRLTGLPPSMVKVTPFKVALKDGTQMELAGGYFPIVMDPKSSQRAIEQDAKETAQNAMQVGYVRATTSKGYTKERTGFGGPLLLDYEQVLTSHVAKVAKDLSHREFMLSSQRFLLDTEVRKALRETLGPEYERQFMPWLRTIINDNNGSVQERLDGLKDFMQKLRGNIVAASLGFNASTSLLQISHAPRMLLYAKSSSLAQAFGDLLAHPIQTSREIRELSPNEMRFRGDNLDRDIRAVLQQPDYKAGYTRKVAVAARFALEIMDHLLSHTLWKAAYRDALDKYIDLPIDQAQVKAVHEADSAVRLGLGSSAPKDLPAIMRSNEFNKFITTLYGFHNGVYNQLRDIGHQVRYDGNVGKATVAGILTVIVPAVLGNWLTGRGPKEDENPGWWAGKRSLAFAADTVPLLRAAVSALEGGHDVQFSPIESVMTKGVKDIAKIASDKQDKDWLGIGLDAAEFGGEFLGVPGSHQAVKTARYAKRTHEGKVQDPNLWNAIVGGGR